jgi:hypothetical protein
MKPTQVWDALYFAYRAAEEEIQIRRGRTELRPRTTEAKISNTIRL